MSWLLNAAYSLLIEGVLVNDACSLSCVWSSNLGDFAWLLGVWYPVSGVPPYPCTGFDAGRLAGIDKGKLGGEFR